jgi:GNAT superfamily N-acetyltransferase
MAGLEIVMAPVSGELLEEYGRVPIAFTVDCRYRMGPKRVLEPVDPPWIKDYDAIRGEGPTRWAKRFDVENWVALSAFLDGHRVGGAVVAHRTEGLDMLRGRDDLACLWDLRVHPTHRREGIGTIDESAYPDFPEEAMLLFTTGL